jgi:hypothetical protein
MYSITFFMIFIQSTQCADQPPRHSHRQRLQSAVEGIRHLTTRACQTPAQPIAQADLPETNLEDYQFPRSTSQNQLEQSQRSIGNQSSTTTDDEPSPQKRRLLEIRKSIEGLKQAVPTPRNVPTDTLNLPSSAHK